MDGSLDTSIIEADAHSLGEALTKKDGIHVVKSAVLPGTTEDTLHPYWLRHQAKPSAGISISP